MRDSFSDQRLINLYQICLLFFTYHMASLLILYLLYFTLLNYPYFEITLPLIPHYQHSSQSYEGHDDQEDLYRVQVQSHVLFNINQKPIQHTMP